LIHIFADFAGDRCDERAFLGGIPLATTREIKAELLVSRLLLFKHLDYEDIAKLRQRT